MMYVTLRSVFMLTILFLRYYHIIRPKPTHIEKENNLPSLGGVCLAWSRAAAGGNWGEVRGISSGHTPAPLYRAPSPLQYINAPSSVQKFIICIHFGTVLSCSTKNSQELSFPGSLVNSSRKREERVRKSRVE